jgi:hypothetical protein
MPNLLSDEEFFNSPDGQLLDDDQFFGDMPAETVLPKTKPESDTFLTGAKKVAENFPERMTKAAGGLMQEAGEGVSMPGESEFLGIATRKEKPGLFDKIQFGIGAARDLPGFVIDKYIDPESPGGRAKRWLSEKGAEIASEASEEIERNQPVGLSPAGRYGVDVTRGIMDMAPAIATGVVTKSPAPALAIMGGQVKGSKYSEDRMAGRTPGQASVSSTFHAAAELIPESIPVAAILKRGTPVMKRFFDATIGEGSQEVITSVMQQVYDAQDIDGMSLKDAMLNIDWDQVMYEGAVGLGVGGGLALGAHPFTKKPEADSEADPVGETFSEEEFFQEGTPRDPDAEPRGFADQCFEAASQAPPPVQDLLSRVLPKHGMLQ